jgi:hypothetical protein
MASRPDCQTVPSDALSQRARRLTYDALARGRRTPWEYQPNLHPRPYVTGAADLTDLEHRRRFPPPG